MELASFSIDQISRQSFALVDLGSALEFLNTRSIEWMTGQDNEWQSLARDWKDYSPALKATLWNKHILKFHRSPKGCALRLLEKFIVHDQLVLDNAVFNSRFKEIAKVWRLEDVARSGIFTPLEIPLELRWSICDKINNNAHILHGINDAGGLYYSLDKLAHDGLYGCGEHLANFANSNDSIQRAYYYLELSRYADIPLVISDAKSEHLINLKEQIARYLHDCLSEKAASAVDYNSLLPGSAEPNISACLPPLQDMILRMSLEKGKPPVLIASEIKASDPAKAYRNKVHELWTLRNADLGTRQIAFKQLDDLVDRVSELAKEPGIGIRYRKRQIGLDWIPLVGPLLKAVGIEKVKIKDPLITPASKVDIFISSWFE